MSRVYNKAFKIGAGFAIFVFLILNIASFINASIECNELNQTFSSVMHCSWGFPAEIDTTEGLIVSGFVIGIGSFISGFLFKFIDSKVSSQN